MNVPRELCKESILEIVSMLIDESNNLFLLEPAKIINFPCISYQGGKYYVTGIRLVAPIQSPVEFDIQVFDEMGVAGMFYITPGFEFINYESMTDENFSHTNYH